MNSNILELIGYISTVVVLISFLMTSVVKLRIVNTIGSLIFTVYALLIKTYPTALLNLGIVCINIYYLLRIARQKNLKTMYTVETDNRYLKKFLEVYEKDINKYFPDFNIADNSADIAYFSYYDMVPAGLLMGDKQDDGSLKILIDYAIPQYRDCSVGKFVLPKLLEDEGYNKLFIENPSIKHVKYLLKSGFRKAGECYELTKS